MASRIALTHHERWDGSGYPQGLAGEAIPLEGRIVAVADAFDALTNERPYKRAWPFGEAVDEIASQSGRQFDPSVVETFLHVVGYSAPFRQQRGA
jgi:putative two-component system response regulator